MKDFFDEDQPKAEAKSSEMILKKHVGLIHCENKLTLVQRKICNILLFNAINKIHEKDIHEIELRHLCNLVGYRSNDIDLIKKSLKSLISVVMEWNLLKDNRQLSVTDTLKKSTAWHASALLAGASIESGVVQYSYSPQIKEVLSSLDMYGRINLFVQSKFNSTYSLVLYENCVRFKSIQHTAWLPFQLFRSLMGLSGKKYPDFKELNRRVILVAVSEINEKSDIKIKPEYKKNGRKIAQIRFLITDNESYKPTFKRMKRDSVEISNQEKIFVSKLSNILINEFKLSNSQSDKIIREYNKEYIVEKITEIKKKKGVENPAAYLMSALKNNYQMTGVKKDESLKVRIRDELVYKEQVEARKIQTLQAEYAKYKLRKYVNAIFENGKIKLEIEEKLLAHIQSKKAFDGHNKFNKLKETGELPGSLSPILVEFVDMHYGKIKILNFEEFISADQDSLE